MQNSQKAFFVLKIDLLSTINSPPNIFLNSTTTTLHVFSIFFGLKINTHIKIRTSNFRFYQTLMTHQSKSWKTGRWGVYKDVWWVGFKTLKGNVVYFLWWRSSTQHKLTLSAKNPYINASCCHWKLQSFQIQVPL